MVTVLFVVSSVGSSTRDNNNGELKRNIVRRLATV
jgi:hypothetical protein